MVQAVIAGQHIADGHRDQVIVSVVESEQLEADQERRNGAVGHAAENGHHADGRAQGRVGADKGSKQTAEGGAGKKRRHDFPALKPRADGKGREQDFQQEGQGGSLAVEGLFDHIHAGAQIIVGLHQQGQQDEEKAAHGSPQIRVFEKTAVLGLEKAHGPAEQDAYEGAQNGQDDDPERRGQV